jgi:hypothetical protein
MQAQYTVEGKAVELVHERLSCPPHIYGLVLLVNTMRRCQNVLFMDNHAVAHMGHLHEPCDFVGAVIEAN